MPVRIALPKGRLLGETAALLKRAGWGLDDYTESMRSYRLSSGTLPDLQAKVFNERDIPVQVAIGNYDLGICGLDWVEELSTKYPGSAPVKIRNLGYGGGVICLAASRSGAVPTIEQLREQEDVVQIATEYPNLAEYLALKLRLRRFSVFPLWGAAEAYPPESSRLSLLSCWSERQVLDLGLAPISVLLRYSTFVIANKDSWEQKDLSAVLSTLSGPATDSGPGTHPAVMPTPAQSAVWDAGPDTVRLALPDGHQQAGTVKLLEKAGIEIEDYPSPEGNRRPKTTLDGVVIKVVRPQDMPLQVANGNFDLAVTGRDWLTDLLAVFPSSPVTELVDLKSGRVRIVAVVSQGVPADDIRTLRELVARRTTPFRVASEYTNIADKYARDNHLGMYKVVPTWGATEAFLPEDADMLIENTETGGTIASHNLKIIDTLFVSTGCLIGGTNGGFSPLKRRRIDGIVEKLRAAAEGE